MPPRRSARLAAHPPEAISLNDDDTDSLVSVGFDCAVCGEWVLPSTSLVAVESMLSVSSAGGTCTMRLMKLFVVRCQLCDAAVE